MRRASVYVHFPFCLAKCPYCDFVSYATERRSIDHQGYADAVLRELEARSATMRGALCIDSVFFGGGTPSLWEPAELGRVLDGVRRTFEIADDLEVTVECNPTSLDRARAEALGKAGVNRLSIGVQALETDQLRFLGRLHDAPGGLAALDAALASGMPRVSADLIFGLPDQSPENACAQALTLADRGPSHLSCYQLTIEAGTPFGDLARKGRLPLADDGRVADAFLAIDEALGARGFEHYEISNYARPGEASRHNLGYWRGREYVGLGCAAVGFVRTDTGESARGVRWRNTADPARYVEQTRASRVDPSVANEALDGETLLNERLMLGLRLQEGVDVERSAEELGVPAWPPSRKRALDKLVAAGRLVREAERIRIPRRQWLWADDTAARLF